MDDPVLHHRDMVANEHIIIGSNSDEKAEFFFIDKLN